MEEYKLTVDKNEQRKYIMQKGNYIIHMVQLLNMQMDIKLGG